MSEPAKPAQNPAISEAMLLRFAEFAGIAIAVGHRAGVTINLESLAAQAAFLSAVPVDQRIEPAPVFRA